MNDLYLQRTRYRGLFFSVGGALLAIPVGIKRKSLAPLVFFRTTGTMLEIILGPVNVEENMQNAKQGY